MAVFEQARLRDLAGAARGWKAGRFAPLYAAGLLAGAAAGLGLTLLFDEPEGFQPATVRPVQSTALEAAGPLDAAVAPAIEVPTWFIPNYDPGAEPPMPAVTPVPVIEAPAVVEPVAEPVVPVAEAPAAAPAAQPVATPAPPVVETRAIEPVAPAPAPARPNFYIPAAVGGNAALEQEMVAAVNVRRAEAGLAPFVFDAGLTEVARIRSQQMVDQGYFGHVDPYGYSMYWELLRHFDYSYAWAGENLAVNNYGVGETVERAVDMLMNSPTHRDNILAGDFYRVGIGEVTSADGRHFFTMIFLG